jgi:hypothetical protein
MIVAVFSLEETTTSRIQVKLTYTRYSHIELRLRMERSLFD